MPRLIETEPTLPPRVGETDADRRRVNRLAAGKNDEWWTQAVEPQTFPAEETTPPWKQNWPTERPETTTPPVEEEGPLDIEGLGVRKTFTPDAPAAPAPPAGTPAPAAPPAGTPAPTRPPATASPTQPPPSASDVAALARAAMAKLSPDALVSRVEKIDRWQEEMEQSYHKERDEIEPLLARRQKMQDELLDYVKDYRATLAQMRPKPPEVGQGLKASPPVPDLKVRPWLDPEGKNAISVIAQTLGALATGISGLVVGAPKTALAQFREAAELWRRDEVDAASGRLAEFQATIQKVKADNEQAWRIYEAADQAFGSNVAAKQAAVVTMMHELKIEDGAISAAAIPYELHRQAIKSNIDTTEKILKGYESLVSTMAKLKDANTSVTKLGTSIGALDAQAAQLRLQKSQTTDPQALAQIDRQLAAVADAHGAITRDAQTTAKGRMEQSAAIKELVTLNKTWEFAEMFTPALNQLALDYETVYRAGLSPPSATKYDAWSAKIQKEYLRQPPEVQQAYQRIQAIWPLIAVGQARGFFNDIGRGGGTKAQYGPIEFKENILPFWGAMGTIKAWRDNIHDWERLIGPRRDALNDLLGGSALAVSPTMPEPEAAAE